ncbi:hypothetical protein FRC03_000498 [Tulasnella sp. 419]|nr:hypothetical protein FRC03_000498 [Tulasnella sp. 419]
MVVQDQSNQNRRERNTLASSILQCPDEILALIFEYLLSSSTESHQLEDLSFVCSRWYWVVESTPVLWSYLYIDNQSQYRQIQKSLAKSQAIPLTINMYRDPNRVLDMLFDHIPRWKWIKFHEYFGSHSFNLDRLGEKPAPLLREFVMERDYHMTFLPTNLFRGYAPLLRHLRIPKQILSWDSPILSGLTSLEIYAWNGRDIPSADQYIRLIKSSPELAKLIIHGRWEDLTSPSPASFVSDLNLPKLSHLELWNISPFTIGSIITSVKGSLQYLSLGIHGLLATNLANHVGLAFVNLDWQLFPASSISPYALEVPRRKSTEHQLKITCTTVYDRNLTLSFSSSGPDEVAILALSFISSNGSKDNRQAIGVNESPVLSLNPLPRLLHRFTRLEEISISFWKGNEGIIHLLGHPIEAILGESQKPVWLCPQLRRLCVDIGFIHVESLLEFARSRYLHHSGFCPEQLEKFEISLYRPTPFSTAREMKELKVIRHEIGTIVGSDVIKILGHPFPFSSHV